MPFHILVVDNQREVSKTIRAGIQSLGTDYSVATAMSGEEALLEARLRKFDLLISEVRLTGMSGMELVRKLRVAKPELKAILVTNSIDRYVRREAADVGIENLLQKPVEMADLLNEVKSILGMGEVQPIAAQEEEGVEPPPSMGISDRLAILRQELEASFSLMISDTGEILMQAGNVDVHLEAEVSSLLAIFSAGPRISRLLGAQLPDNLYVFKGHQQILVMTHAGESHVLLVGIPSIHTALSKIDRVYQVIQQGTYDLQAILKDMGVGSPVQEILASTEPAIISVEEPEVQEVYELDAGLDALFSVGDSTSQKADLDSFWEVASVEDTGIVSSSDALSYEQARQLGLAPDQEEK